MQLDEQLRRQLTIFQQNEITEHQIYSKLAGLMGPSENRRILEQIAGDELRHYREWSKYTQTEVAPDRFKIWMYYWISRVLGLTFGIKLMEKGEEKAENNYKPLLQRLDNYVCLAWALTAAVLIIAQFNYYVSVVKDEPFKKRFLEMAAVSLGVAGLSFLVGYVARRVLGVEV